MIYKGYFTTKSGGRYEVSITSPIGSTTKTLRLSAEPCVVSWGGDTEDIYKPLILSGATITVSVTDYMFDLYAASAQAVPVVVKKDGAIAWQGYVTPCIYSQDYRRAKFDLQIECIDCLASLDYIKYQPASLSIRPFKDIIVEALTKSGMTVSNIYVDESRFTLASRYIADVNWFDEDNKPSTYREVLEHILRYCHLSMFAVGTDVYIVNWDNLIKTTSTLNRYNASMASFVSVAVPTPVELGNMAMGCALSLSEIRNSYNVIGSAYKSSKFVEDPLAGENLYKRVLDNSIYWTQAVSGFKSGKKTQTWSHQVLYFDSASDKVILHQRASNNTAYTGTHTPAQEGNYFSAWQFKSRGWNSSDGLPESLDYNYYLGVRVKIGGSSSNTIRDRWEPVLTLKGLLGNCSVFPSNSYLCVSLSAMFARTDKMFCPDYASLLSLEQKIDGTKPFYYMRVRIGNMYYDASGNWTTKANYIAVNIGDDKAYRNFTWHKTNNTNTITTNVDQLDGYLIPLPNNRVLTGELVVEICSPYHARYDSYDHVYLKNIEVSFATPSATTDKYTEADAEYDNKYSDSVNGGTEEGDDIDLNITTYDGDGYSRAMPIRHNGTNYEIIDEDTEEPQEYKIIRSYLGQYAQPNRIIDGDVCAELLPNMVIVDEECKYIVCKTQVNLANETSEATLIQKR